MKTLIEMVKAFWREEEGMEMSEYAVVGVIICVVTAAAFVSLSNGIKAGIQLITDCVTNPRTCGTGTGG